jgi:hypothetical protein
MSFSWPVFSDPVPLSGGRTWTAQFESYDQRNDDCYYAVTVHEGDRVIGRFMVQVGLWWAGNDWTGPEFVERLAKELGQVAATGHTNTTYTGSLASWSSSTRRED